MSAGRELDRSKSVKAVIAEDEATLLDELRETLAALWPELSISAVATNGIQALHEMEQHAPDVLFLDIQMPGMSGLEVAKRASGRCRRDLQVHRVVIAEQNATETVVLRLQ